MSNPDNFVEHRRALMRLSVQVPALVAAWKLTKDKRYATPAAAHLRAWFSRRAHADESEPAICAGDSRPHHRSGDRHHRHDPSGRGRAGDRNLKDSSALSMTELGSDHAMVQGLSGLDDHEQEWNRRTRCERITTTTCWVMQVAAFAQLTGDRKLLDYGRDGSRPLSSQIRLPRTAVFRKSCAGPSLTVIRSSILRRWRLFVRFFDAKDNLFTFQTADGRGFRRAMEYMAPFIRDKKSWPLKPDVMYDDQWPMRQNSLLFAGLRVQSPGICRGLEKLPADLEGRRGDSQFFYSAAGFVGGVISVYARSASSRSDG